VGIKDDNFSKKHKAINRYSNTDNHVISGHSCKKKKKVLWVRAEDWFCSQRYFQRSMWKKKNLRHKKEPPFLGTKL
jgi:hypothetical protein